MSANGQNKKDIPPQFANMTLTYNSIEEMAQNSKLVIGMHTGFVMVEKMTRAMLPHAKIEYYKTNADLAYMTVSGKIDGFINDEPVIRYAALEVPDLGYIHCGIDPMNIVVCFQKNDKGAALRDEFNTYIRKWKADGTLKKIDDLWLSNDEAHKVVDLNFKGTKGTLRFATEAETPPFDYIKDGKIVGYEMDLIARFCREAGYGLSVQNVPFDSLVMGLETGSYDFVAACLTETPAHKESTHVSEPIYLSECVMAVRILDHGNGANMTDGTMTGEKVYTSLSELNKSGVKIGIQTGSAFDEMVAEFFPNVAMQYFNTNTDMANLVAQGTLDALIVDEPVAQSLCANIAGIGYLSDYLESANFAVAFPKTEKGAALRKQMNEFFEKVKTDGRMSAWQSVWFGDDEGKKTIDLSRLTAKNGTLRLATNAEYPPFEYIKDGKIVGYDIACAVEFCFEYGYGLEINDMNFDAVIPSLVAGAYDFALSGLTVTEERAESVYFSTPNYDGGSVAIVRAAGNFGAAGKVAPASAKPSFTSSLAASFEKTFVRESRWKLVASGIGITVLISILSAVLGTILGFGICGLRLSGNKIADTAALVYIRIMQGMPMVVLLMILFYIVFAKTGLNSVWVAVIGFGMNFGAYVSEMIRTGILAVDKGQSEAALALGYSKPHLFVKIVLPQAARHFLPVFQGEFISLVKMTSVVGYIAIQDLTKASDIIRSRTYEAFFPLITTALIYFIIAWFLTRVLSALQTRLDPKKRKRVVKGIDTKDTGTNQIVKVVEPNSHEKQTADSMISIHHLKKAYPNVTPLRDVNAEIRKGDVISIIGPSGTGKSTLLRCLNRLEDATSGEVLIGGSAITAGKSASREVCALRRKMGMVFQSFNLFNHLSIIENIMCAQVDLLHRTRQEAYERGMELLRTVGLADKALNYPDELSGGQKQRAAIARTLAMNPEIVLFDEPTSALDPTMVGEVLSVIRNLAKQGLTMLIVTHEMQFARDVSTRVFYMDEGVIYEDGTPEQIFANPQKEKTRQFINHLKVLEENIAGKDFDFIATVNRLQSFAEKNQVAEKTARNMQLVFEELVKQSLLPHLAEPFVITLTTEYAESDGSVAMRLTYEGAELNPIEQCDEISRKLIEGATHSYAHSYSATDCVNRVEMNIV